LFQEVYNFSKIDYNLKLEFGAFDLQLIFSLEFIVYPFFFT